MKDWNAPGGLRGNWVQVFDLHGYNTSSSVKKEKTEQSDRLMEVVTLM